MPTTIAAGQHTETRLPARPDGTPWPLLLVHGDQITGADTAAELLAVLIPGYGQIAHDDVATTTRCGGVTNPPPPPPRNCRRHC